MFLFNGKISIPSGYKIRCKITGAEGSAKDGKPYVLLIPGGPGYTHKSMESTYQNIVQSLEEQNQEIPHFIFFDPLSCGESDTAKNPETEYTLLSFARMNAELVEEIQKKFDIPHLVLRIAGRSFGSIVAMHFPMVRDWSSPDEKIYLDKIFSISGPIYSHALSHDDTIQFIHETFPHLNHPAIEASLSKLHAGKIENRSDYISEVCINLAVLYNGSYEHIINYLSYFSYCPKVLEWGTFLLSFNSIVGKMHLSLTGCNLDLMNHFFRNDYHGLNLPQLISENLESYKKYEIICLVGSKDYISFWSLHVEPLVNLLEETLSGISFTEARHQDLPKLTYELIATLMNNGSVEPLIEDNSVIVEEYHLAQNFHHAANTNQHKGARID